MKRFCIAALMSIILLFTFRPDLCGEYDSDQIILSWTDDSAHTQTITWHSASKKDGYVQYNRRACSFLRSIR